MLIGPLEISLAVAALLIGATGTFSPCGLSVIETIGPTGHSGGRRTTLAACAAFLPGAIAGGLVTFGALAALGESLHGAGGRAAYLVAAGLAAIAALLELRGTRIVPQIRRQLPETWRRAMPMPLAAALYGVLLGLGFTTFVLTFGVWALAGISVAIAEPWLGALLGACFGLGRAIPIVALAPLAGGRAGTRATELICERPGVYLGLRRGDAAVLAAAAIALAVVPVSAGARSVAVSDAADPSATRESLAFERSGGAAVLRRGAGEIPLGGTDPAIGGAYVATIAGDSVRLLERFTLAPVAQVQAPGADAVAVSSGWLAYRAPLQGGGDGIFARNISNPAAPGPILAVATVGGPAQLSAPGLGGRSLVYAVARPSGSRIVHRVLGTRKGRAVARSGRVLLFSPATKGRHLAYVRTDARRSRLLIRGIRARGPGKLLFSLKRSRGQLWSTALTERFAFVTVIDPGANGAAARIVKVRRKNARRARLGGRPPRGGGNHRF
ncbi:MAG TPA: hypothetical protein VHH72_01015 [Solirubrobacterales bacterium]|nr:hypothetical protein [Solirubrobacterales bacterium]